MQQTWFTQTNRVPRRCTCHAHIRTVHWAPRGSPSQKYLPASRVFLFHNTRLLSSDRVRRFFFPIPPASLENICLPRGFFFFITHGCYLRTVCDALSSKFSIARHFTPAFDSRVVKFSVSTSFPQTPPLHTQTTKTPRARAPTHTPTHHNPSLTRNPSKVPPPAAAAARPPLSTSAGLPVQLTHRSPYPGRPEFLR